jgi:hypothetical protein
VNCHGLHNGDKVFIIIDAGLLREPVKNPLSLVPLKCPIGLEIVLEDPLAGDNIGDTGEHCQVPSVVGHKSGVVFLHSCPPMSTGEGSLN